MAASVASGNIQYANWISRIDLIDPSRLPTPAGMTVTYGWGPLPKLCRELAASAGIKLPDAG